MNLSKALLIVVACAVASVSSVHARRLTPQKAPPAQTSSQTSASPAEPSSPASQTQSPQTASPQQQPATPPPQQPAPERTPPATKESGAQTNQQTTPAQTNQQPAPPANQPALNASPQQTPAQTTPAAPAPTTATPTVPLNQTRIPSAALNPSQTNAPSPAPISRDEAVRLALGQASAFQQAALNERIAAEDVRQARAALLPKLSAAPSVIYTMPSTATPAPGTSRAASFIAANAISEYQALANVAGELDTSGRLHATIRRNLALLEAAHAGTEVARRALVAAVDDAYFGLALATAKRRAAEQNLATAQEFERVTSLLLQGGEVAPIDVTRARLQTNARRDELEQARAGESVAADSLRVLIGYDFLQPIATVDLQTTLPQPGEIETFAADAIKTRPEFAQFDAERRAAEQDVRIARGERRPQVTYNIAGGFDSDALRPQRIGEHAGASATVGVSIPIFDNGASRSREAQAQLRAQIAENERALALRTFAQAFYSARAQALSAQTRIRIAADALRDAENNLTVSLARYRAGEAQIVEVTDAQSTLISQRTAFYQALFDYQTARARLMQTTGR